MKYYPQTQFLIYPSIWWLRSFLAMIVLTLIGPYGNQIASAEPVYGADSTIIHRNVVLGIVHLNFDCYADSIIGSMNDEFSYVPRCIRWGKPRPGDQIDTLGEGPGCLGEIPREKKRQQTLISYPSWRRASVSIAFEHLNADSLVDLVIYIRGEEQDGDGEWHRVQRPLVIFGQHGLDTLDNLDLGAMERFQIEPFFGMELREDVDLTEPGIRDLSGETSWVLNPPQLDAPQAPAPPALLASVGTAGAATVHIYPNPTASKALIQADAIPAGEYIVEIAGVNGWVHLRTKVRTEERGNLFQSLDVRDLPSGYYIVRLTYAGTTYGTYPIIVAR